MSAPAVTVVIATYESRTSYLRNAIVSALSQDIGDLEVVVTDDSPDDRLRAVVEGFEDNRLRYRRNSRRAGPAMNHAIAFREACAPFIAILNHDDCWHSSFLSTLISPLQVDESLVLAFCDHFLIDASGAIDVGRSNSMSQAFGRQALAGGVHRPFTKLLASQTIPLAMGSLIRKNALNLSHLPSRTGPAYDLWIASRLARTGLGAYYCPERLSSWRVHTSNISATSSVEWALGSAFCWTTIAQDDGFSEIRREAWTKASRSLRTAARLFVSRGQIRQGGRAFLGSVGLRFQCSGIVAGSSGLDLNKKGISD